MKWLDLLHRWTGGVLGLVLAMLGLSGAILVHKEDWIALPHAGDALVTDPARIAAATERLLPAPRGGESLILASDRFGLIQARFADGGGAYADQAGEIVTRWHSQWQRPELWLFDLHHHLLTGDVGETVIGIAGLAGVFFVISGTILWWRTRRTFRWRLLPTRLTRPAIIWHHRDIGIVLAPLLLMATLTGTMMIFRPVAGLVLWPFSAPSAIEAALKPPKLKSTPLSSPPDWRALMQQAQARFPDARIRIVALPRKAGDAITVRMKRADEWLPNGRSMVWFDAGTGRMLASRDALAQPLGARLFNQVYPLHSIRSTRSTPPRSAALPIAW